MGRSGDDVMVGDTNELSIIAKESVNYICGSENTQGFYETRGKQRPLKKPAEKIGLIEKRTKGYLISRWKLSETLLLLEKCPKCEVK